MFQGKAYLLLDAAKLNFFCMAKAEPDFLEVFANEPNLTLRFFMLHINIF
jgi:hypothetical protein